MDNFKKNSNSDALAGSVEDWSNIPITATHLEVADVSGNNLGKIKQIVGDHSREIHFAVFEFREDLGLGRKSYIIPWDIFQNHTSGAYLLLDKDFDFIRNAPAYSTNHLPDETAQYLKDVIEYWRQ